MSSPGAATDDSASQPHFRLLVVAWIVYASFYVGRVNLAVTIPGLEAERGFSGFEIGVLATAFFWTYAVAGIPGGHLADRFGPRVIVSVGLVGSGLMNAWVAVSGVFWIALVAWSVNGVFQAMGWPAILTAVTASAPQHRRQRTSAAFGTCFIVGSIAALGLGGVIADHVGTSALFALSGTYLAILGVLWAVFVRVPRQLSVSAVTETPRSGRLSVLLPATIATGTTYVTILVWTPAYFVDRHDLTVSQAGLVASVLPLSGVVAIVVVARLVRSASATSVVGLCGWLMAGAAVLGLLPLTESLAACVAILWVANGLVGAASSVVLGVFPSIVSTSHPALIVGLFSFAFNMGGGMASPTVGILADGGAWGPTFLGLAVLLFVAAVWTVHVARGKLCLSLASSAP